MTFDYRWGIWKYRAVFKTTNVAAKYLQVEFTPPNGGRMVILHTMTGPDDYSGNETVKMSIRDSAGNLVAVLMKDLTSIDNARITFPAPEGTAQGGGLGLTANPGQLVIAGDDSLVWETSQLAQNEELTIAIRAWLWGDLPTVSKANSETPADVTVTETYNVVI